MKYFREALLVGMTLLLGSETAFGQLAPVAQGGVFGTTSSTSPTRQRLDLTFALAEARDSEVPVVFLPGASGSGPQQGGYSTMLFGTADYIRSRRRLDVVATAFSAFRYYERRDVLTPVSYDAAIGATVPMPRNTRVQVNQTAAYSPSYIYRLFPTVIPLGLGEAIPSSPDYREERLKSYEYTSQLTLESGTARGMRASVTAEYERTKFFEREAPELRSELPRPDLELYGGRATLSHGYGRTGLFSVEYQYRTGEFGFGGLSIEHRLRIGTEYSRALSASRRAMFSLNIAPATLVVPAATNRSEIAGTLYRLEGDATAQYRFRRTWSLSGTFRRGVEYIAVFQTPVFRDAARLELTGFVSRRLDLSASAGYAIGGSALTPRNTGQYFDTYIGIIQARYALGHRVALYSQYLYSYYDLRRLPELASRLPSVFELHGGRLGVIVWFPTQGR